MPNGDGGFTFPRFTGFKGVTGLYLYVEYCSKGLGMWRSDVTWVGALGGLTTNFAGVTDWGDPSPNSVTAEFP